MSGYDFATSTEERAHRPLTEADAAATYHSVMTGNTYMLLPGGSHWCPKCKTACPCTCCAATVAAVMSDQRAAPPGSVEYRSTG